MSDQVTPNTIRVGDRVVATEDLAWVNMLSPRMDYMISAGGFGTVVEVDPERDLVMIRWDHAPNDLNGKKQVGAHHYMPKYLHNGWPIERLTWKERLLRRRL